jgi:hypothetical protein
MAVNLGQYNAIALSPFESVTSNWHFSLLTWTKLRALSLENILIFFCSDHWGFLRVCRQKAKMYTN